MVRKAFFFLLFSVPLAMYGQGNRYMVFFKDKNGTPYSITNPGAFLSQASILRRTNQNITTTAEDLPVNPTYVGQVSGAGAKTFFTTRWMNGVLIEADVSLIPMLEALSSVDRVELVAPGKKLIGGRTKHFKSGSENSAEATQVQLEMIGIDNMHQIGYKGEGIDIAIFDSGFIGVNTAVPFSQVFADNRIVSQKDFVGNTSNIFQYDNHGTSVFSVMGAYSVGQFTGGVYNANFHLYVTEDISSEYKIEEYNWLFAAEKADSIGVRVINSSLGYNTFDDPSMDYTTLQLDGKTAIISKAAALASSKGIIVVSSAGNSGGTPWQLVLPPADADGILAVGSVTSTFLKSTFSAVGPTADGRIKPDVMAQGSGTSKINSNGTISTASGTSMSSPLIASLAAGVWQSYPNLSSNEVIDAILQSADRASNPDNLYGYGIPNYVAIRNYLLNKDIEEELFAYPNPTTDLVRLIIKNPSDQPVTIIIYDGQGRVVHEYSSVILWSNNPQVLDFTQQPAGLYFVRVISDNGTNTIRVIKN